MSFLDFIAIVSIMVGGSALICHAYLAEVTGFPSVPWWGRGMMVLIGLALWFRASMIIQYGDVSLSECGMYMAVAVLLTAMFRKHFLAGYRGRYENDERD